MAKKTAKKKPVRRKLVTKVKRRKEPTAKELDRRALALGWEGKQAMLPGEKPRDPRAARTFKVRGVDGDREVKMPAVEPETAFAYRRRPFSHPGSAAYNARMELRITREQGEAWDRVSKLARLTRAEWIRSTCDAAVAKAGSK